MTILLNSTFELANGDDRTARVCGRRGIVLSQDTPRAVRLRAEWPTLFPTRAVRTVAINLEISLPACADLAAAEEQAHAFIASIPKGGDSLEFVIDDSTITYPQWALVSAEPQSLGVTNLLRVALEATDPQVSAEVRPQFESGGLQSFETNTFA